LSSCQTTATSVVCSLSLHDALPILIFFVLGDFQDGGKRLFSEQLPRCPFAEAQGAQVLPVLNPTFPLLLSFVFEEGTFPFLPSFLELLPQLADRVIVIQFFIAKRSEEHTSELQSRENLVCR